MAFDENKGTIVLDKIIPSSPQDTYPTHIANYGRGGYKTVSSIGERDAIPDDRLTVGCEVRVTNSEGSTVYYLESFNASSPHNWKVATGGLDEEALNALKGQPGGLAELDAEGKVPASQTRTIVFRGTFLNETTFNSVSGVPHAGIENAIYIDNRNGKIYSYTNGKFVRDTVYWEEI